MGEEKDLKYHKVGFTSNRMRVEDYETLLDHGFTRCGTYYYCRNQMKSCCEIYQYRVILDNFKMSRSQKQTLKRFHRYLNTGSIYADGEKPDETKED